jgi:hypothetical protein
MDVLVLSKSRSTGMKHDSTPILNLVLGFLRLLLGGPAPREVRRWRVVSWRAELPVLVSAGAGVLVPVRTETFRPFLAHPPGSGRAALAHGAGAAGVWLMAGRPAVLRSDSGV